MKYVSMKKDLEISLIIFSFIRTGMTQSGLICGKLKHGDSTKIVEYL